MPALIPRACRKRGCPGTTTDRSGYCEQHRNEGWQQHQQGKSRHERGYGSKWDIKRARILKRDNHLCQNCLRTGRAVAATTHPNGRSTKTSRSHLKGYPQFPSISTSRGSTGLSGWPKNLMPLASCLSWMPGLWSCW